jgi:metal-responsive CopG/Arc/MetJ family transcriptional regulator
MIAIPPNIAATIDRIAGPGRRSEFVVELLERELQRREQLEAIDASAGIWREQDHPELAEGIENWVRNMRAEWEVRLDGLEAERLRP